jgi:hypothetical protein
MPADPASVAAVSTRNRLTDFNPPQWMVVLAGNPTPGIPASTTTHTIPERQSMASNRQDGQGARVRCYANPACPECAGTGTGPGFGPALPDEPCRNCLSVEHSVWQDETDRLIREGTR